MKIAQLSGVVCLLLGGCSSPVEAVPNSPINANSAVMDVELGIIQHCFKEFQERNSIPGFAGHDLLVFRLESVDDALRNRFDIPVFPGDLEVSPVNDLGLSPVYRMRGRPLPYSATLVAHVEAMGQGKVRVEVGAADARVLVGRKYAVGHSWRQLDWRSVRPTTIEEHVLLTDIARCVGRPDSVLPTRLPAEI